jgi:hypothetical protein
LALQLPPQSTSVSVEFFAPSSQWVATHFLVVTLQAPVAQSPAAAQPPPSAHFVLQLPPQSRSVSVTSLMPFSQVVPTQTLLTLQTLDWQSLAPRHLRPEGHFAQSLPPQSVSVSDPFLILSVQDGGRAVQLPLPLQKLPPLGQVLWGSLPEATAVHSPLPPRLHA